MRPTVTSLHLACTLALLTALPAAAEITLTGRSAANGAQPRERSLSADRAAKLTQPDFELFVPYYVVNANNGSGTTTLFAVRNILFDTITLRVEYFPVTGGTVIETVLLDERETFTRNIRDVGGLPATGGGFKEGWAILSARDPVTGDLLEDTYLHGDTFIVIPSQDFATGNVLEPTDSFCFLWDTRFAVGGAFDDTEIRLTIPFKAPGAPSIIATVGVFDESGAFWGDVDISANGPIGTIFATDILDAIDGGPDFGVFEWDFDGAAFVSQEMKAEGRYAAGWNPACLDSAFLRAEARPAGE